jgi:excisionase family DNA binding protein
MTMSLQKKTTITECLSVKDLAETLGVSLSTSWALINNRKISFTRIGRRIIITRQHVDEFLARNETPAFDGKSAARRMTGGIDK